jgi:hypothetical protein
VETSSVEAHLAVDLRSLQPRQQGPATGGIWINVGDMSFPQAGWNDFLVPILAGWAETVVNLCREAYATAVVYFMDGPYEVRVTRQSKTDWILAFVDARASPPEIRGPVRVAAAPFVVSVAAAVRDVLQVCATLGHSSRDVDALARIAPALEEVSHHQEN